VNLKQKILTVIALVVFVLIGFDDMVRRWESAAVEGFVLWFILAVVYTGLFFVFKDRPKQ